MPIEGTLEDERKSAPPSRAPRRVPWSRVRRLVSSVLLLSASVIALAYWWYSGHNGSPVTKVYHLQEPGSTSPHVTVQVTRPHLGGMERTTDQPGTIRAFEFAPLYAKISGYLKELKVDRGDRVKRGQLLAQIYDPEVDVAVLQAQASLEHSQATERQAEARLKTAKVGVQASEAKLGQALAVLEQTVSQRTYRKKALDRIT